ncbi:hypothetical protein CYMTET_39291, partial [Cymbomonas tetramitiformis]
MNHLSRGLARAAVAKTRLFPHNLADLRPSSSLAAVEDFVKPLDKLLIANRGEIACRIIETAKRLGIRTVAVHSELDSNALHAKLADEAICIGPAAPSESYLRMERLVEAAIQTGAHAVHPGYGFLSENAKFADTLRAAGVTLVGPPAAAMLSMGDKKEAKSIMEKAGVPVVPGYHGSDQSLERLVEEAGRVGFPLLIKAVMGGGGKGMKLAWKQEDVEEALASAQREARAAFGDERVLLERFITRPRHIEVQVFCDQHGNGVYLFERDC